MTINCVRRKSLATLGLAFAVLSVSAVIVAGQTLKPAPDKPAAETQTRPASTRRNDANEAFDLNIDERHYSQENFRASTTVGTERRADKLDLQVGVAFAAGRIDLLLRNVHGRVRFRGTLDRIFEVMNNRQAPSAVVPVAPVPSPY